MKEYETPDMEKRLFRSGDVVAVSEAANQSIVSTKDSAVAAETQESSWDDSWN